MRIYLFLTTSGFSPFWYLQDGISINSPHSTSMLNFLGQDLIDATVNQKIYTQNQPKPRNGGLLALYRWYMMQYEIAYDQNLSQISAGDIELNWYLNYCDIENVKLGGTMQAILHGTIGTSSASSSNILSQYTSIGKAMGAGVLAGVGRKVIDDNTVNSSTGENTLSLPEDLFLNLTKNISNAYDNLPEAKFNLLNSVLGGSSGGPTPVNFTLKANIELEGSITNPGAFPSQPVSLPVPGTQGTPAQGYVPLYNQILGVINFNGKPVIQTTCKIGSRSGEDPRNGWQYTNTTYSLSFPTSNYSSYLMINPAVQQIANVVIEKQDIVTVDKYTGEVTINPGLYWEEGYVEHGSYLPLKPVFDVGVRFTIKVTPLNGSPASTIIKTFLLQEERKLVNVP